MGHPGAACDAAAVATTGSERGQGTGRSGSPGAGGRAGAAATGRGGGASRAGRVPAAGPGRASQPAALTIVTGPEPFLVARTVGQVVARLRAQSPEADLRQIDASEPAALAGLPEALSPSLFSPAAIAVVTNLESASDALVDLLVGLVADLGDNRAVVTHTGAKGRKHLDRVSGLDLPGAVDVITVPAIKNAKATCDFLVNQAKFAGRDLPESAAKALVRAIGSDLPLLVGSLEQLMADFPADPITAEDVRTQCAGVAEVTGFSYADALWGRDGMGALIQLRLGEAANSLSAPAATGAAATGLRSMVRAASVPAGLPDSEVARIAGVPSFKVRALVAARRKWSDRELAAAVVGLARLDVAVKGGLLPGDNLDPSQKSYLLARWSTAAPVRHGADLPGDLGAKGPARTGIG